MKSTIFSILACLCLSSFSVAQCDGLSNLAPAAYLESGHEALHPRQVTMTSTPSFMTSYTTSNSFSRNSTLSTSTSTETGAAATSINTEPSAIASSSSNPTSGGGDGGGNTSAGGNPMSTGMKAGVGAGCAAAGAVLLGVVVWWCRPARRQPKPKNQDGPQMSEQARSATQGANSAVSSNSSGTDQSVNVTKANTWAAGPARGAQFNASARSITAAD